MKKLLLIAVGAVLFSCSTSNDVVSNGFIQKRKYTKGWHINKRAKVSDKKGVKQNEEILIEDRNETLVLVEDAKIKSLEKETSKFIIASNNSLKKEETTKNKTLVSSNDVDLHSKSNQEKTIEVNEKNYVVREFSTREVKSFNKEITTQGGNASGASVILLIILALFVSWLSVGIYTGWSGNAWVINLILWLLGGGFYILGFGISGAGILMTIAIVHAILILLGII